MRIRLILAAMVLVSICVGSANAQIAAISLDNVSGLYAPDTLPVNQPVEFFFRLQNTIGLTISGSTNGFAVYSPDGATWDPGMFIDTIRVIFPPSTTIDTTFYGRFINPATSFGGILRWTGGNGTTTFTMYDGGAFVNTVSEDGLGADTVGFGGYVQSTGAGIPNTLDDIGWKVRIGGIHASSHGKTLCLDSSFYPPTGYWKWSEGSAEGIVPTWDGPHCYTIFDPNAPQEPAPTITCPAQGVTQQICAPTQICIPLPIADLGAGTVTTTGGGVWSNGQLCWNINGTTSFTEHVTATNGGGSDVCDITVNVTMGTAAQITSCPGPVTQNICAPELVCAPITITGATGGVTSAKGGTYSAANNEICWNITATTSFTDTIIATGDCGKDTCIVAVNVTLTPAAEITCPTTPVDVQICASQAVCIPLTIVNATGVTSSAGGTWFNDELCWDIAGSVSFTDTVVATNSCGPDSCFIPVTVSLVSAPVISCPTTPVVQDLCGAQDICVNVPISDATTVTSLYGTWNNGVLCWNVQGPLDIIDTVVATNSCGVDSCFIPVQVTFTPAAEITCPPDPITATVCAEQDFCIPLPVVNYTAVTSTMGTWSNDQLCWHVAGPINAVDTVVAFSVCGNDTCLIPVTIDFASAPVITCPSPVTTDLCGAQDVCVNVPITDAVTVTSKLGTWTNGVLCWNVQGPLNETDTVVATNACGVDSCFIPILVTFTPSAAITCPPDPVTASVCSEQDFCIPLPVTNATAVTSTLGTWSNDQLCLHVAGPINTEDTVVAFSECGNDTCIIPIQISFGSAPIIACPTETVQINLTAPGQACFPIGIQFADNVVVPQGYTYSNNNICFNATSDVVDSVIVMALNTCGYDSCMVHYAVTIDKQLVVAPDTLYFTVQEGDNSTYTDDFQVTESSNFAIGYTASETSGWFDLSAAGGTTPDVMTVSVTIGALVPNVYLDSVLFGSGEAVNMPFYRHVMLTVTDKPNTQPTITAINDVTIDECTDLSIPVTADDLDLTDVLVLTLSPDDVSNATFVDNGDGTGLFTFMPDFNQAGSYDFTITVSDGAATAFTSFTVTVGDCLPGERNDISIASVSAVPGSRMEIPVNFTNLCDLSVLDATIGWTTDSLYLDSVTFVGSRLEGYGLATAAIDNALHTVLIHFEQSAGDVPVGSGLLATMYFSVAAFAPAGAYALDIVGTPSFDINCDGTETVTPFFFKGFAVIDDAPGYTCGYVVDEEGVGIVGAHVEMWQDYPCVGPDYMTTTNTFGAYSFSGFAFGTFDIYAYTTDGMYYPAVAENNNFGAVGIQLTLPAVQALLLSDAYIFYYCDISYFRQCQMPIGSVVEAKDADGTICGRFFVAEIGKYGFMPVYSDEPGTPEDEGAMTGNTISFFINGVLAQATGNVIYPTATAPNFDRIEVCLDAGAIITQSCPLIDGGWNLISWNLDTPSDMIEDVLASILPCVEVVVGFEQGGLAYDPLLVDFSTLWNVDHLSGYWVKIKPGCPATLELEGLEVDESTPIVITSGWNLVSYLPTDERAPVDALCSIIDNPIVGNLQIAYGFDGDVDVFKPGAGGLNDLLLMGPCHGYWVKTLTNGVLDYSGCLVKSAAPKVVVPARHALAAPEDVTVTTSWINVYSRDLRVNGERIKSGAEITAHNNAGEKIGYFRMTQDGKFGFMAVYADDANSAGAAGLRPGDEFYLAVDGNKTEETFEWAEMGDRMEIGSLTAKATGGTLPEAYSLSQNYPNPFNPTTNINFTLPVAGKAKIEIYNMLGKLIATPFDGFAEAGENLVVWDATDFAGNRVASGVYFYRLSADSFSTTRKMTLVK